MNDVVALVEGQTEQIFIRDQLSPHLVMRGINIWAVLPGRTRKQGGVKNWISARDDILRILKEDRYCTTMFDFYAMPTDWPGREEAATLPWPLRASHVEVEIGKEIALKLGTSFNPVRFIPYVQLHEFEALLFASTMVLSNTAAAISHRSETFLLGKFDEILEAAGHPEAINDSYETCPSRRIENLVPGFRKRLHSPLTTARIGLEELSADCDHFGSWLNTLEALGT